VHVDSNRIGQVLTNLLNNALRHTPAGGTVIIWPSATAKTSAISVSDNGDGMTPEQLEHAFERFYRA
jgi:two-component system sensor histidine kinase BaeS